MDYLQIFFVLLFLFVSGCVEREMVILSDPPNAQVWLDGQSLGKTPITTPFSFYGTREISLYRQGYETYTIMQDVEPPWYQYFPMDFVAEFLIPLDLQDKQTFNYTLKPHFPRTVQEKSELKKRGESLHKISQSHQ